MELIHKLIYNNEDVIIDEPIGFDNLKMTMKRHDLHGIGAEFSEENLEFYGNAANIIKQAYNANIDSEVMYVVYTDNRLLYSGKCDLSTYHENKSDYWSISVKVGEIGVKTTFNNRIDTEIDLNMPKTIDGESVVSPDWLNLQIPQKHLLYTNKYGGEERKTPQYEWGNLINIDYYITEFYIKLPLHNQINEFGMVDEQADANGENAPFYTYAGEEDSIEKYGDATISISGHLEVFVDIGGTINDNRVFLQFKLLSKDNSTGEISEEWSSDRITAYDTMHKYRITRDFDIEAIPAKKAVTLVAFLQDTSFSVAHYTKITVTEESWMRMSMYDNLPEEKPITTPMLLVHDALNITSHTISENALAVKSEWYQTPESNWNAGAIGGGALKALTNGYHIRGLFTEGEKVRNMPLSFKDLIVSLNALDCIGWGFSTENGETCIRVERWSWFYQDTVILTLANVAEMQIDIDIDRIITELKIGYKKFTTSEQYNSIESPHGTRTFANNIKAVYKKNTLECDFIADNYAIEETRRARTNIKTTEEFTYDEKIFIFELIKKNNIYQIGNTALEAENVGNEKEFINAKLTPRRMAGRWKDYLFATNNQTAFNFTTGEINYKASFQDQPRYSGNTISLQPFDNATKQQEKDSILYTPAKFKAEKITFSYPLTIEQYLTVKANPYGLICANGIYGWIIDFKYNFEDGMANFTLLAKNTNTQLPSLLQ